MTLKKKGLAQKLGIKEGMRIKLVNRPDYYESLFTSFPEVQLKVRGKIDFIHFFCDSRSTLIKRLPVFLRQIEQNGMIWVSWPKKASKVISDMSEDHIRDYALEIGLVDVKVCSVNDVWSALKLVIPLKFRK